VSGLLGSVKAWVVIGVLAALAVVGVGWALLITPQRTTLDELQSEIARQEDSNMSARAAIVRLKKEAEELPARKAELAAMKVTIPPVAGMPDLVRALNTIAKASGATLGEVTPGPAAAVDAVVTSSGKNADPAAPVTGLQQIPVTIRITGTYQQTEKFLAEIQKLKRGVLVTDFAFDSGTVTALEPFDTTIGADVFINPELGSKSTTAATPAPSPTPTTSG